MINVSETARSHFRHLLETQGDGAVGVRLSVVHRGTPKADVVLEFAEQVDLDGNERKLEYAEVTLFVEAASVNYLDAAEIDYRVSASGGELNIRAPKIRGVAPREDAGIEERVRWLLDNEINPRLAAHKGHVRLEEVTADNVVLLRFGGGCHGCGMADVTLKQGIETTLMASIPSISAVRDATDHSTGSAPFISR